MHYQPQQLYGTADTGAICSKILLVQANFGNGNFSAVRKKLTLQRLIRVEFAIIKYRSTKVYKRLDSSVFLKCPDF